MNRFSQETGVSFPSLDDLNLDEMIKLFHALPEEIVSKICHDVKDEIKLYTLGIPEMILDTFEQEERILEKEKERRK